MSVLDEIVAGGYDYVYIFRTSDEFVSVYADLFDAPPANLSLYRVEPGGTPLLVRVGG